jgi:CDP-diacylglycerol--glycerol-3-phosphate 3-phosphatidyltransferase
MSESSSSEATNEVINVPNLISASRLLLAVVLIALIPLGYYWASLVIFLVAAGTDWVDGWWARKFNQVTQVGRILDSFCDKIVILGAFIMLAEAMKGEFEWYARITGWMATLVLGREMLVTALRSFIENAGGDFSAKMAGKIKFVLQCVAVSLCLWLLAKKGDGETISSIELTLMSASIWFALASTVYSGAGYVIAAAKFISQAAQSE